MANEIKEKIIKEPINQKENLMDEQEKTAFEQKQREDIGNLKSFKKIAHFNSWLKQIRDRSDTKEKKIISDNICLEFYGNKLEDVKWVWGKKRGRKKKESANNAE